MYEIVHQHLHCTTDTIPIDLKIERMWYLCSLITTQILFCYHFSSDKNVKKKIIIIFKPSTEIFAVVVAWFYDGNVHTTFE